MVNFRVLTGDNHVSSYSVPPYTPERAEIRTMLAAQANMDTDRRADRARIKDGFVHAIVWTDAATGADGGSSHRT